MRAALLYFSFFGLAVFSACQIYSESSRKNLVFVHEKQEKKILVSLPKNYEKQMAVADSLSVREWFYTYADGSVFYVSCNAPWPTKNQPAIESGGKPERNPVRDLIVYKGTDNQGRFWKEIRMEEIRAGYLQVPRTNLEKFEQALLSLQIKKDQ